MRDLDVPIKTGVLRFILGPSVLWMNRRSFNSLLMLNLGPTKRAVEGPFAVTLKPLNLNQAMIEAASSEKRF